MTTTEKPRGAGRAPARRPILVFLLAALAAASWTPDAAAQDEYGDQDQQAEEPQAAEPQAPAAVQPPQASEREIQDLNAIATLSVGLVIQSFGYIGAYGDLLSSGAYDSQQVINMLGDTVKYLGNAHRELARYQDPGFAVSSGDRQYLAEVTTILELLIEEAESLRGFANSRAEGDLARYRVARDNAWKRIDRLIKP
ncbi:MAG: hypothetical protein LBQ12_07845 [Deltaproteobacteria bacterium]|jgi:hypothetical protein|nr:hypothetical protein [Deltaproteobacteria bacterium]